MWRNFGVCTWNSRYSLVCEEANIWIVSENSISLVASYLANDFETFEAVRKVVCGLGRYSEEVRNITNIENRPPVERFQKLEPVGSTPPKVLY